MSEEQRTEGAEDMEQVQNTEATQEAKDAEAVEQVEDTEATENADTAEATAEATEHAEDAEAVETEEAAAQSPERTRQSVLGEVSKGDVILEVQDLSVKFWVNDGWFTAAKDLNYELKAGEVMAIVGESGSGKTQSSMSLVGLLPSNGRATGSAKLRGFELIGLSGQQLRNIRGKEIAVIFQEPMTALNPLYQVGFQIVETLRTHFVMNPSVAKAKALELMRLVEIPEPEVRFNSYPHQLSGGQRQRIMIAMARADHCVGCDGSGRNPEADARAARTRGCGHHLDHARYGCGGRYGRPDHRDEGRRSRGARHVRRDLR